MATAEDELRSVLITGASSGIGAACTLDLAERGFQVFAGVRKPEDGERLVQQAPDHIRAVILDVTDQESIERAAREIAAQTGRGRLWGLVNNAGILVSAPLECVALDRMRRQFEVNVFGTLAVTQAMLPMIRRARGRIVTVGSIAGRAAPPYFGPYSATKFALESMTDVLRMELRTWGIRVSIIEPDSVITPIWDKLDASNQQAVELTDDAQRLYGDDVAAMAQAAAKMGARGMPVDRVVKAVHHALTSRRPKTRYPLGFRTRLATWAISRIPDWIRDWYMLRELGMPTR